MLGRTTSRLLWMTGTFVNCKKCNQLREECGLKLSISQSVGPCHGAESVEGRDVSQMVPRGESHGGAVGASGASGHMV